MSLSGATQEGVRYRMIFRGVALQVKRSGEFSATHFYVWAKSEEEAMKAAQRVFRAAGYIITIRKRSGDEGDLDDPGRVRWEFR